MTLLLLLPLLPPVVPHQLTIMIGEGVDAAQRSAGGEGSGCGSARPPPPPSICKHALATARSTRYNPTTTTPIRQPICTSQASRKAPSVMPVHNSSHHQSFSLHGLSPPPSFCQKGTT